MKDPAITHALFMDCGRVATRNSYKLIFEVPLENADKALAALGGTPITGKEKWCALALLDPALFEKKLQAEQQPETPAPEPEKVKERKPFHTLPRSQQAAILIQDERFREWWFGRPGTSADEADASIKANFGIRSKRDLDQGGDIFDEWDGTVRSYFETIGQSTWERPA